MFKHLITVEEFCDANVLKQAFAPSRFDHKLTGQFWRLTGLKWPQLDGLVKRVARHCGPVSELRQDHGLAHRVRAQIGLKAEALNAWNLDFEHM